MGRFLKFLIALALLPLVAGEVWTLIDLARLSLSADQWKSADWLISLGAGFLVWFLIFIFLPRAMWLYVLGHEFTHALAAMIAGGKVSAFRVTSQGGHIMTDRVNWWIALSPYFVPIYALIWIGLWLTVDFYHPLKDWQPILYFGLGLFWSFHLTFTWSMLHPRQTDLSGEGYLFSAVVIAFFNLLGFLILLSFLAPGGLLAAAHLFGAKIIQSYLITGRLLAHFFAWAVASWQRRHF